MVNGIILLALVLISINFLLPLVNKNIANETVRTVIALVVSLGIAAPFLWVFIAKRPGNQTCKQLWLEKNYNRGPLYIIEVIRNLLGILFIAFLVYRAGSNLIAILIIVPVTILIMYIFSRRIQKVYQRM